MLTHMFWAYGPLSKMERMCVNSFIKNGFELQIWTYSQKEIIISGASVRDAREIVPESSVFLNQAGSYAGFSDLFRYCVLYLYGGLYVDTDVLSLKPASLIPNIPFLVTERAQDGGIKINGNVIHNPTRRNGNLIDLARVYAEKFPKCDITWSEIGPALLTAIVQSYPGHGFKIYPPGFANNVNYWDCPNVFVDESKIFYVTEDMYFLHLYNEMWRRAGVDKNSRFSDDCLYEKLEKISCSY